jgi:hypothetical protein
MKFPARTTAILSWAMGVTVVVSEWFLYARATSGFPGQVNTTYFVVLRVSASLTYFAVLFAVGAVVWLLGEIRDRLPERR